MKITAAKPQRFYRCRDIFRQKSILTLKIKARDYAGMFFDVERYEKALIKK